MLSDKELLQRISRVVKASETARSFSELSNSVGLAEGVIRYTLEFSITDKQIVLTNIKKNRRQKKINDIVEASKCAHSFSEISRLVKIQEGSIRYALRFSKKDKQIVLINIERNKKLKVVDKIIEASKTSKHYFEIVGKIRYSYDTIMNLLDEFSEAKAVVERNLSNNRDMHASSL